MLHKGHLAVKGDPDCPKFFPGIPMPSKAECMKNGTYYGDYKKKGFGPGECLYDRTNQIDYGYIPKLVRDDRKRIGDMDIAKEDNARIVPVRSSTIYGHYLKNSPILPLLDNDAKKHRHRYKDEIRNGFCRDNGTGLKLDMQYASNIDKFDVW